MSNHDQLTNDLQEIGRLIDLMVVQRDRLMAQRDALLEAAKKALTIRSAAGRDFGAARLHCDFVEAELRSAIADAERTTD